MSVPAETLRTHLAYTTWASRKLVDEAARLSAEEQRRDFQTADHNVIGTLAHVYAGDRIWLARLQGEPIAQFISDADYHLSVLQNDWPALLERWREWAGGMTDQSVAKLLAYESRGAKYEQPIWQVVLHVVNHGTHHRGQVSGFLRALGHTPPALDLMAYYREQAAHA